MSLKRGFLESSEHLEPRELTLEHVSANATREKAKSELRLPLQRNRFAT